ncbi:MAG: translation elongation factor Ts [Dehalococcoidales bacterium]|nr:translation elongation factor Ts [Dehalococcoidales bacterium]
MDISTEAVKELREKTGAGIMDCKRALIEAGGDKAKAMEILQQQGLARAEKKAARVASQGLVDSYIHGGGRIGVLVEVNCETDFVARTPEFADLVHDIAMQIAAQNPTYVNEDEVPEGAEITPEHDVLLKQPFIKNPGQTIGELITANIAKIGENIKVRRFARFELGR